MSLQSEPIIRQMVSIESDRSGFCTSGSTRWYFLPS